MAVDPSFSKVSLLLHCDGINGSTTFADSSGTPKTVTPVSTTAISTAQSKYGGASVYFNGSTTSLTVPSSTAFDIAASEDFCIECWVYRSVDPGSVYTMVMSRQEAGSTTLAFQLRFSPTQKLEVILRANGSSTIYTLAGTTSVSIGAWHHCVVARVSGTIRLFLNGAIEASLANALAFTPNVSAVLNIGALFDGAARTNYFNGHVDDIRWTKADGRYAAGFTPPSGAFPDNGYTVSGVVRDDTGAPVARAVRAYRRDTGVLVGSVTSSASTGAFSIACPTTDEVSVLYLDDAAGTLYNDLVSRVIPA